MQPIRHSPILPSFRFEQELLPLEAFQKTLNELVHQDDFLPTIENQDLYLKLRFTGKTCQTIELSDFTFTLYKLNSLPSHFLPSITHLTLRRVTFDPLLHGSKEILCKHLGEFQKLKRLELIECELSNTFLRNLAKNCSHLLELHIVGCISQNELLTHSGFQTLRQIQGLQKLVLTGMNVSPNTIQFLQSELPKCIITHDQKLPQPESSQAHLVDPQLFQKYLQKRMKGPSGGCTQEMIEYLTSHAGQVQELCLSRIDLDGDRVSMIASSPITKLTLIDASVSFLLGEQDMQKFKQLEEVHLIRCSGVLSALQHVPQLKTVILQDCSCIQDEIQTLRQNNRVTISVQGEESKRKRVSTPREIQPQKVQPQEVQLITETPLTLSVHVEGGPSPAATSNDLAASTKRKSSLQPLQVPIKSSLRNLELSFKEVHPEITPREGSSITMIQIAPPEEDLHISMHGMSLANTQNSTSEQGSRTNPDDLTATVVQFKKPHEGPVVHPEDDEDVQAPVHIAKEPPYEYKKPKKDLKAITAKYTIETKNDKINSLLLSTEPYLWIMDAEGEDILIKLPKTPTQESLKELMDVCVYAMHVEFANCILDDNIEYQLPKATALIFRNCPVTKKLISRVVAPLTELSIQGIDFSDDPFEEIATQFPNLETLKMKECSFTEAGLQQLHKLKHIQNVSWTQKT
jgi:hypothetical protein